MNSYLLTITVISIIVIITPNILPMINVVAQTENNKTTLNCAYIPANISKNAFSLQTPHSDVCDIVIMRQSPDIEGYNGISLNKFIAINSIAEIMAMPSNMSTGTNNTTNTSQTNENNPQIFAIGEFALLESELKPFLQSISKNNWNITAIHNHPILERPAMMFVHWDTQGDLNTFIKQINSLASQYDTLQQQQQQQQQQQEQQANQGNASQNPLAEIGEKLGEVFMGNDTDK
ncbi:MAG TPA: DUF1259 domain-containing protein [Nitrososphaeraceae archaeon]|nr:DUF1259 domain-containing protein [Nitrososphaeraceae archaeon]